MERKVREGFTPYDKKHWFKVGTWDKPTCLFKGSSGWVGEDGCGGRMTGEGMWLDRDCCSGSGSREKNLMSVLCWSGKQSTSSRHVPNCSWLNCMIDRLCELKKGRGERHWWSLGDCLNSGTIEFNTETKNTRKVKMRYQRKMVHANKEVSATEVSQNHPNGAVSQISVQIYPGTLMNELKRQVWVQR